MMIAEAILEVVVNIFNVTVFGTLICAFGNLIIMLFGENHSG